MTSNLTRLIPSLAALFIVANILGFMPPPADAADIGAHVGIATISPCPSFCGPVPPGNADFAFDGGENESSASTSINNFDGNGQGMVSLTGPTLLPVLGAEVSRTQTRASRWVQRVCKRSITLVKQPQTLLSILCWMAKPMRPIHSTPRLVRR